MRQETGGRTPLQLAAAGGHDQAVAALLASGARVEMCDAGGWTALRLATANGHDGVAKALRVTPL